MLKDPMKHESAWLSFWPLTGVIWRISLKKKKKKLCPRPLNQDVCFEVRSKLGM